MHINWTVFLICFIAFLALSEYRKWPERLGHALAIWFYNSRVRYRHKLYDKYVVMFGTYFDQIYASKGYAAFSKRKVGCLVPPSMMSFDEWEIYTFGSAAKRPK